MADQNAVNLALGIASITYGGVLGIFLLGRFTRARGAPVIAGFLAGTAFSTYLFFFPPLAWAHALWTWCAPDALTFAAEAFTTPKIFWPWFVPAGAAVTVATALVLSRLGRGKTFS